MPKALAGLLATVVLLSCAPAPLLAHGRLKSSSPAAGAHLARAPTQLRLDFSESPELAFTAVRLLSASGRQIPLGALAFAPDSRRAIVARVTGAMEAGTYVVMWQMGGDDGHPVRGRFDFTVAPGAMDTSAAPGATSRMHHDPVAMPQGGGFGAESPFYVAIRWAEFAALLLIVGAVAFRYFVLGSLRRGAHAQGEGAGSVFVADAERTAARMGQVAAGTLAATLALRLLAQSYAMHGAAGAFDPGLVSGMVRTTMWGWGWLLQLVGVVLAGVGFHRAATVRPGAHEPAPWWRLAACGAVAAAFSPALSSHAASAPKLRALAMVADGVHVLGASSWLGTLAVVLMAGLAAAIGQAPEARGPLARSLINAFSPVALVSAAVAAATGVFAAWLHVGTIPNLWGTPYGITLLIKLAVLGLVVLTGFYNWRFMQPRLGTDEGTTGLQRSARAEVGVALLVLLVTAVLVASPTSMDATM